MEVVTASPSPKKKTDREESIENKDRKGKGGRGGRGRGGIVAKITMYSVVGYNNKNV